MSGCHELRAKISSRLPAVAQFAETVTEYLRSFEVATEVVFQVNVAIEELLTNTIKYGYRDAQERTIDVKIVVMAEAVYINIEDDAPAFNPFLIGARGITGNIDDMPIGGLGIRLVKEMMDEVGYRRVRGRNRVRLRRALHGDAHPKPAVNTRTS